MAPDPYVQHDWSTMTWTLMFIVMIIAVSIVVGVFIYATARIDAQSGGYVPEAEPDPEPQPGTAVVSSYPDVTGSLPAHAS